MVNDKVDLISLGLVPYAEALQLQERLWQSRRLDQASDTLLLLQHPPTITLGASGGLEDLLISFEHLQRLGVELLETNRGGRATFHGPGQLIAYPIMKLFDRDLHAYLWKLEEVVLRLLFNWGIDARREQRYPGVWVGNQKIAALGVAVRDGVTTHGLALNIDPDLRYFQLIVPCGLGDRGVTSMREVLSQPVVLEEVARRFVSEFSNVFMRKVEPHPMADSGLVAPAFQEENRV